MTRWDGQPANAPRRSKLEALLLNRIERAGLPKPEEQVRRLIPGRLYVWDFYYPQARLLIECEGGTWARTRSGHSTGSGIRRDCEKGNHAVLQGYRLLRFTVDQIESGEAVEMIARALGAD